MRNVEVHKRNAAGYRLDLAEGLAGALHADGSLTLEAGDGRALDFPPAQVERLAELLALGAGLRSQARRRRSRASYADRYGVEG